jgi:sialate O-acetylesterase
MVLQRDGPVPIWGTAPAGASVEVVFAGQTQTTHAAESGGWQVTLNPMTASAEARTLTITAWLPGETNTLVQALDDVLVGEVWVGSGQSNMDMPVHQYTEGDSVLAALAAADYPNLRLLVSVNNTPWRQAVPAHIRLFSAQLFVFGLRLHQELGVPVGLMEGAVGGTPSGQWLREGGGP